MNRLNDERDENVDTDHFYQILHESHIELQSVTSSSPINFLSRQTASWSNLDERPVRVEVEEWPCMHDLYVTAESEVKSNRLGQVVTQADMPGR